MFRLTKPAVALLAFVLFGAASRAAPVDGTAPSNESPLENVREQILQMTDFLDTILPGTLGKHNLTLHFTPKFGDFRSREFVRYPFEFRYGATNHLELIAGMTPFAPNPGNSGRDHRWGPGELDFGAKYDLGRPLLFYDEATFGIEDRVPLGTPPVPLNDGFTHVRPYLATSRYLRSLPYTTFYTNFSYDRSAKLTHRSPPPPEVIRRHVLEIAPGLLYKPAEFGYFGEYRFRHIEEPTGWHLGHEMQIGTIWDVPLYRSARLHLPGKWQLEIGYKFETEQGYPRNHGISARVNWRTTLREVLDNVSPEGHRKTNGASGADHD